MRYFGLYIGHRQAEQRIKSVISVKQYEQQWMIIDYSATGHSWGFNRAKVINNQRNTYKHKIVESLLMKKHSIVTGNRAVARFLLVGGQAGGNINLSIETFLQNREKLYC